MRLITLALALLVSGCATGWHATLGPDVPPEVRTAVEEGPVFETEFHAEAMVYRIPVGHLDAECDAVWQALLAAPVVAPRGFRDVGIEYNDRVRARERRQLLKFDFPHLTVARVDGMYLLDLVDPDDDDHHYLVEFEQTPLLEQAWMDLARSADIAAATPPAEAEHPVVYTLVDDSLPARR